MPYSSRFLRLVMIGTLYNVETWTCSLNFAGGTSAVAPDEVPQDVVDACATWIATSVISERALLTTLKLNEIGPDGRYVRPTTVQHDYVAPFPAGNSNTNLPAQNALAITLRTAAQRGRASRGRFFQPLPAVNVDSSGFIPAAQRLAILDGAETLLNALNEALDPWRLGILSDVGEGASRPVTRVEVGRVVDTIRSRRNKLAEDYDGRDLVIT